MNRTMRWTKTHIICITYCWNDGKPAKVYGWGYRKQDDKTIVEKFLKLIKKADVIIGKNSNRFDNKHINTHMMWHNMDGMPDWIKHTDDLEVHMRRRFYLPSYSLDYFSAELGLGGKNPMKFDDWVHIQTQDSKHGADAYKKMLIYGMKDVEDTRAIWEYCEKHFEPKYNAGTLHTKDGSLLCKTCGSVNIYKNGVRASGKTKYQSYFCRDHGGYAGRAAIRKDNTVGTIG